MLFENRMNGRTRVRWWIAGLLPALVLAPAAAAQDAAESEMQEESVDEPAEVFREEVIVTVRKREEQIQDVPLSITVLNAEQVQRAQIETLDDLTLVAPNVNIFQPRSETSGGALFIRGIGQEDTVFTVDSGVGLYLDGIFLPRAQGALLDILDVERIEVLRGPQGTLYGRNTIAGAIHYISRPPTNEQSAEVELTVGNYERNDFKAKLNIPLVRDKLLFRLAAGSFQNEGFEFNEFTGEHTKSRDSLAGRATLAWHAREDLDVIFRGDAVRERSGLHVGSLVRPQTSALDFQGLLAGEMVTFQPPDDPFRVRSLVQNRNDQDTWGLAATVQWSWSDRLLLKSLTSYRDLVRDAREDIDATEARAVDVAINHHHDQASQELQLTYVAGDRWNLVGGLYYFREDDDQLDFTDATAKGFSLNASYAQTTRAYAAYAEANFQLSDRVSLVSGLRFSYEEKEFSRQFEQHRGDPATGDENLWGGFGQPGARPPDFFPGNGFRLTDIRGATESWDALTPRLGIEFQWTGDAMLYASIARGFKSGGFNGRATEASNPAQREPYDPEFAWTYEVGAKTSWRDGRLLVNPTLFYNDYTDLQLASFGSVDTDGDGVDDQFLPLFTNAAEASTEGFELQVNAYPRRDLVLFLGVGYTRSEFTKYVEGGVDVADQREFANAPEWTATFGGSYAFPAGRHSLRIGGDVNYQDGRYLTVSNLPDLFQGDYTLVNAFATLETEGGHWWVTLGSRNLTDERYLTAGVDASSPPFGVVAGYWGDPRTYTLTVGTHFRGGS